MKNINEIIILSDKIKILKKELIEKMVGLDKYEKKKILELNYNNPLI